MFETIVRFSLERPKTVVLLTGVLAVLGLVSFARLPFDAFPDSTPVLVTIHASAPGLSPEEIERRIAFPIEQSISGIPGLENVRSTSRAGFTLVSVTFADGTDLFRGRQAVAERLASVELPSEIERPELGPITSGLGEVFHYVMVGRGRSLSDVRIAHDTLIAPRLRSVPGVAEVVAWGGDERRWAVSVDPARLAARGLSLSNVETALTNAAGSVGAGSLDTGGEAKLVRGVALFQDRDELGEIGIGGDPAAPIRISDVASIVSDREPRVGAVTSGGEGEVVLGLGFLLLGENSRSVTQALRNRFDEISKSLPPGIEASVVYERTDLIDRVLRTVRTNLLEAAALVIAVLLVLLGSIRAGIIVASIIPLSFLFATNLMLWAGIAGSLLSLGALDFGLLVDSSVILVENASRRLREAREGRSEIDVLVAAAMEVRRPTLFGELVIVMVYLPILTLEGVEGKLFRPMAATVVFALVGSLILSLTWTPAVVRLALPRRENHGEPRWLVVIGRAYRGALDALLDRAFVVIVAAALLVVGAAIVASRLGTEFVPRLSEGTIVINAVRLAGVSVDESVRYTTRIEAILKEAFPDEIERIWTRSGTAELATDPMGLELSDVFITLRPRATWRAARTQEELVRLMRERLSSLPGMRLVFTQPIEMRVNEMIAGVRGDVGIKIFGPDLELLRESAVRAAGIIRTIPGAADVTVEAVAGQPVLEISIDRPKAARAGVSASEILRVVEAIGGREVAEGWDGVRPVPIVLRIRPDAVQDREAIGRLPIETAHGGTVPLEDVASIRTTTSPAVITREWGERRIVVSANVSGRDIGSFARDVKMALDSQLKLPPGMDVRFGGQIEHLERARARMAVVLPLSVVAIFLLLLATYGRVGDALRVFIGVPLAAVGGVAALALRDLPVSLPALLGFVALSGISVLGDMVLVSTIRQNLDAGLSPREAVLEAASRRLRPVLATALVASLGFVPMVLATGPGAEVQRPLATVVIGGIVSSTILTLLVLPVLWSTTPGKVLARRANFRG